MLPKQTINFNTKIQQNSPITLHICDQQIEYSDHRSNNGQKTHLKTLHSHPSRQRQHSTKAAVSTQSTRFPPHTQNGVIIYHTIIRPILTSASLVWGTAVSCQLQMLQHFQNKVLRIITNAPRYTRNEQPHNELKVDTIQHHIKNLATELYRKIPTIENPQVRELASYERLRRLHPQLIGRRTRPIRLSGTGLGLEDSPGPGTTKLPASSTSLNFLEDPLSFLTL
ncbi:hypothetical protein PR048_003830 [Dryococelus australis]|uniref:Uncharacterized protein n=1 Tax=Dryococelus australis TaxID=614101 RepID=A0ABQ9IPA2_9NEOP|nr:hypothetical protein PR048_003830 [Dryococelus australis]